MMKQYEHVPVELTEASKAALETGNPDDAGLVQRIAVLEGIVEKQSRQIRDMQAIIQYITYSR